MVVVVGPNKNPTVSQSHGPNITLKLNFNFFLPVKKISAMTTNVVKYSTPFCHESIK